MPQLDRSRIAVAIQTLPLGIKPGLAMPRTWSAGECCSPAPMATFLREPQGLRIEKHSDRGTMIRQGSHAATPHRRPALHTAVLLRWLIDRVRV